MNWGQHYFKYYYIKISDLCSQINAVECTLLQLSDIRVQNTNVFLKFPKMN